MLFYGSIGEGLGYLESMADAGYVKGVYVRPRKLTEPDETPADGDDDTT